MITDKDIAAYIGYPVTDTSSYDAEDLRRAAKASYFEGKREATRDWAYWKDGVQFVGSCGKTLAQALDIISEEENT
jgi:hypothetical protein